MEQQVMTGITGIGNLNELQVARPIKGARNLPAADAPSTDQDAVKISEAAQQAAEVARYLRESAKDSEIRQERVEAAKQSLSEGRQRVEEVLTELASALVSYI
jgi:anti-sigma28 factor (negative regulator of flagellin synthesis)